MSSSDISKIYSNISKFSDKIIVKNRLKMLRIIKNQINKETIESVLDIGTTEDKNYISSNFIIKNLGEFKNYKSISDQNIKSDFFHNTLKKSITENFSSDEINNFKSDLVISNATIEHVGSFENQLKMCDNIIKLAKKYFIIITPNRYHPIEFHTKLPLIHWLPKNIHRLILSKIGLNFHSKETNLNLLSENDLNILIRKCNHSNFLIKKTYFLFFKSNLLVIGKKILS